MATAIVDELARNGVRFLVLSPGSRSAALAIAATAHPMIETRVVLDERSAGFHALGRAKVTGEPAAVLCTSGSAVGHYTPAVVEADMSKTPVIVLSADRPSRLLGIAANQTIEQNDFFGPRVRQSSSIEAPDDGEDLNSFWRSTTSLVVQEAKGANGNPGPVHLNISFEEPTVPVTHDGRSSGTEYPDTIDGRQDGRTWIESSESVPPYDSLSIDGGLVLVVAGDGEYNRRALLSEASRLGWPVLATAESGLRGERVVSRYHHILVEKIPPGLMPDAAVVVGRVGPSQRLEGFVSAVPFEFRLDRWGRHINPSLSATAVLQVDPVSALRTVDVGSPDDWAERWYSADRAVEAAFDDLSELNGSSIAMALNHMTWETLVVASSLPIRDVDAHLHRSGRVIANRGASGIDGFVSTALGVASAASKVLAVSGDLSLLHDNNGFIVDVIDDLVVVAVDNNGGGLFDQLPQKKHAPEYERLFVSPHDRDLRDVARLHRLGYSEVGSVDELIEVANAALDVGGRTLVHAQVDRLEDAFSRAKLDTRAAALFESVDS